MLETKGKPTGVPVGARLLILLKNVWNGKAACVEVCSEKPQGMVVLGGRD